MSAALRPIESTTCAQKYDDRTEKRSLVVFVEASTGQSFTRLAWHAMSSCISYTPCSLQWFAPSGRVESHSRSHKGPGERVGSVHTRVPSINPLANEGNCDHEAPVSTISPLSAVASLAIDVQSCALGVELVTLFCAILPRRFLVQFGEARAWCQST